MAGELIQIKVDRDFSLMPRLLPPQVREAVSAFGRFVRLAESIAATPMLSRAERRARLVALEAMLDGPRAAAAAESKTSTNDTDTAVMAALCDSLARHGVEDKNARLILRTLQQTVAKAAKADRDDSAVVHETWTEVIAYATDVAAPIGRHMLALCDEDPKRCGPPADALCAAMRILKEFRDCDNPAEPGSVHCIPSEYMRDASITLHHLSAPAARGQTRAVLDRVLDGVDALLIEAATLPNLTRTRRLRIYIRIVLCRARKLSRRCRRGDPLQERVELSAWERQSCVLLNITRGLAGR